MELSKIEAQLVCACGKTTRFEAVLARPGGKAPIGCACGRKFVIEQLDPEKVASITIDPAGITDGEIPDEPPKVH